MTDFRLVQKDRKEAFGSGDYIFRCCENRFFKRLDTRFAAGNKKVAPY